MASIMLKRMSLRPLNTIHKPHSVALGLFVGLGIGQKKETKNKVSSDYYTSLTLLTPDEGPSLETSIFPLSFQVVRESLPFAYSQSTYTVGCSNSTRLRLVGLSADCSFQ